MLSEFSTTAMILGWCAVFAAARAWVGYWFVSRLGGRPNVADPLGISLVVPALVAAPLVIVLAHGIFGINLQLPIGLFATPFEMMLATAPAAGVLVAASGLWTRIGQSLPREFAQWRAMPFATAGLVIGRSPRSSLRRVVIASVLTRSFGDCMPWLFGELLIVETVFGAPGLGLNAWHLARTRDVQGLAAVLSALGGLYLAMTVATTAVYRWIGKRLESYA